MLKDIYTGLAYYYATSLIVLAGAMLGHYFVIPCRELPTARHGEFLDALLAWDGAWYARIVADGYAYSPDRQSSVAFFPGYPFLASALSRASGLGSRLSLLVVSHCSLAAAFVLMAKYVRLRFPEALEDVHDYTVLSFGLLPTTYFFRAAYSESLFVLLLLLAMWGIERRWNAIWIATIVGAATACRSVGVALLIPLAMHLWESSRTRTNFALRSLVLLPWACWGLVAWMAYQSIEFGDPSAFIQTQRHWSTRHDTLFSWNGLAALASFRPIRSVYDPASACHWSSFPPHDNPAFNLMFANPIYFVFTAVLVVGGRVKNWLSNRETALCGALLLIPYILQADRACMAAQARYASSIFPAYMVLGNLLFRLPAPVAAIVLAISAVMLAIYSALFVSWYWFY